MRTTVLLLLSLTILTGILYPLVVTLIAQGFFPHQANGSLRKVGDRIVGSELIGQSFREDRYFWGRLSSTSPVPYNAASSSGSNFGPSHPALKEAAAARIAALRTSDPSLKSIPVDLVTSSGSGLDPHISLAAAEAQIPRVAAARNLPVSEVRELVRRSTQGRQLGLLGEPRVEVLGLNLALDQLVGGR